VRLVWLFSLIAAIPTLLVVIFASLLFQSGVEFWFPTIRAACWKTPAALRAAIMPTSCAMWAASVAMAGDVRGYFDQAPITSQDFAAGYSWQVYSRKMDESAIVERAATAPCARPPSSIPTARTTASGSRPTSCASSMPASRSS
jgi:two-component system nitrogen regulation sensor histidine kinase NtrY